jgi:hypothetical protein
MNFREATQADLEEVAKASISRGEKWVPTQVDFVYTLEHEGRVLGIGGIKLLNSHSAWAWFNLTDAAQGHMIVVYRVIKEWLEHLVKEKQLKCLMASVDPTFPEAIRSATERLSCF